MLYAMKDKQQIMKDKNIRKLKDFQCNIGRQSSGVVGAIHGHISSRMET